MSLPDAERFARLRLARCERVGPVSFRQLLERFGSAEAICAATASQWLSAGAERSKVQLPDEDDAAVLGDVAWLAGGADHLARRRSGPAALAGDDPSLRAGRLWRLVELAGRQSSGVSR